MPTPVGPLGPDEIDPNDPDLWDWDAASPARVRSPIWVRLTALTIAVILVAFVIASFAR
ncbi:MAG TPA: hypothetical protein VK771_06920 [Acidimicrobiia bacterium]|nr:hypothetical protein [Acidimicrobiia bacterium]